MWSPVEQVRLPDPILSEGELTSLQAIESLKPTTLPTFFDVSDGIEGALQRGLDKLCEAADEAVRSGSQLLVLSDRTDYMVCSWNRQFTITRNPLLTSLPACLLGDTAYNKGQWMAVYSRDCHLLALVLRCIASLVLTLIYYWTLAFSFWLPISLFRTWENGKFILMKFLFQDATKPAIPPLLAVGAVHHHLISNGMRMSASIVVDSAQCFSTHHFACLIGYGARYALVGSSYPSLSVLLHCWVPCVWHITTVWTVSNTWDTECWHIITEWTL